MKTKPLKKFLILLISSISLITITVLACGGGDWDSTEGSMFAPEIINQPKYAPFFRTGEYPFYTSAGYSDDGYYSGYGYDADKYQSFNTINSEEWHTSFFEKKIPTAAISYWLYTASLNQIDSMIFYLKDKPSNLNTASKTNSLKEFGLNAKATSFLYYVGFAKRNETFSAPDYETTWDANPKTKVNKNISIDKQITGGQTFFVKATDPFLKERYAYQLLRLYFYGKKHNETIDFYNKNTTLFQSDNSIKWRALGYTAGSYYRQKNYAQSNYLYSLIYDNYEPLKKSAYLSFHPLQKTEWDQSLNAAKNAHEKEILWQLLGLYADDVTAMEEILKLNPKSETVELLLVRAVNKQEENMDGILNRDLKTQIESPTKIDNSLLAFLNKTSSNANGLNNPVVWHLSAAYLNYASNNYTLADEQLKRAENLCKNNTLLKSQYHLISALGKIKKIKTINDKVEIDLLPDLKVIYAKKTKEESYLRYTSAQTWMRKSLASLYINNHEIGKAELIYPGSYYKNFADTTHIIEMINYYNKEKKSDFENLFFENAYITNNNYIELLAIRYAQMDMLDASINTFGKMTESTKTLLGNPFTIHIKDCHDCDHLAIQKTKYTSLDFIKKMKEMKETANNKPNEAAQNYFLIANGFYNMTYFGNARVFYENSVDNSVNNYDHEQVIEENCNLALKYYLLAKEKSTDNEFKAKCTFMAAKCEQNKFFLNIPKGYKGDFKSGIYFTSLKKEYSSTKYYSEIIKECGYFKTYINHK